MLKYLFILPFEQIVVDSNLKTTDTIESEFYFYGYDSTNEYEHVIKKFDCDYLTHDFLHALIRANTCYESQFKGLEYSHKPRIGIYDKNKKLIGVVFDNDIPYNKITHLSLTKNFYSTSKDAQDIYNYYFDNLSKLDIIKAILGKMSFECFLSCDFDNLSKVFNTEDKDKINRCLSNLDIDLLKIYDVSFSCNTWFLKYLGNDFKYSFSLVNYIINQ